MEQGLLDSVMEEISKRINADKTARMLQREYKLIFCAGAFHEYKLGCYCRISEEEVRRRILELVEDRGSVNKIKDIIYRLQGYAYAEVEKLNSSVLLNLKNGLFDLDKGVLIDHSVSILSTIQLNVSYLGQGQCEKWLQTLREVFEGNQDKINLLQEFFGLCLTREVKYEKALLCVGEGSNGKSVVLYVLEKLLGESNCSAIPLEKFDNTHYLANLFGKLVNISLETNAKSDIYDSTFKAIVSGDMIEVDPKFKKPFSFRPFCKLVFAMNSLPRVADKTDAFFRRLIILRFNRQFKEQEQNKNLKEELLAELDGIFCWCLEGLNNLKKRGYFILDKTTQNEIQEYRKENNNVLLYVEDRCTFSQELQVIKEVIYKDYSDWCQGNGYKALGKIKFGKELSKHFVGIKDGRATHGMRVWEGIGLNGQ